MGLLLILLGWSACDLAAPQAACRGAAGIDSVHAARLACVGWLDYVETHVCRIDYRDVVPPEQPNTAIYGEAHCHDGSITIARRRPDARGRIEQISTREQLRTIVHEAAHLEDACRHGEPPAVAAENAFSTDYARAREAEAALAHERVRAGNLYFEDLCLITVTVSSDSL